jgi:hypothetical protein
LAAGEGKGIGENEDDKMIEGDFRMGKKARMYLQESHSSPEMKKLKTYPLLQHI